MCRIKEGYVGRVISFMTMVDYASRHFFLHKSKNIILLSVSGVIWGACQRDRTGVAFRRLCNCAWFFFSFFACYSCARVTRVVISDTWHIVVSEQPLSVRRDYFLSEELSYYSNMKEKGNIDSRISLSFPFSFSFYALSLSSLSLPPSLSFPFLLYFSPPLFLFILLLLLRKWIR